MVDTEENYRYNYLQQFKPVNENDVRRQLYTRLASFYDNQHYSCLSQCETASDLTFLTLREGKCYRNCVTKSMYLYKSLGLRAKDSACMLQQQENDELRKKIANRWRTGFTNKCFRWQGYPAECDHLRAFGIAILTSQSPIFKCWLSTTTI